MTDTLVFKWDADKPLPKELLAAMKPEIGSGSLVVYPTNTLYGLGTSIRSADGIEAVNKLKSRPAGMPLSIIADVSQIRTFCSVPEQARRFIDLRETRITMVLRASHDAPPAIVHEGTVGVRLPCSELTASLVGCLGPLTATSANLHGAPAPAEVGTAMAQLGDRVSFYIDAGRLDGIPTTIVDFTDDRPKIIREGALSAREVMG